jgi:hypothetical protein
MNIYFFLSLSFSKTTLLTIFSYNCALFTGIPKLEDANDAGTARSLDCTLILTEGDSAKSMAVSGIASIGRDKYGVFPLKGLLYKYQHEGLVLYCGL